MEKEFYHNKLKANEISFDKVFERVTRKNKDSVSDNVLTISAKIGLVNQKDFFNRKIASENISGYYLLKKGEFAYNKSYSKGYPFGAIKPLELYSEGVVSTLYICFKLKNQTRINISFFKHFFESGAFDREIYTIAQEGARNHGLLNVSLPDFFKLLIPNPADSDKEKISNAFDSLHEELIVLSKLRLELKKQKNGLMQQLLIGKKRVVI